MDVKGEVLLQFFNKKSMLRNETKTFLKPKIFSIVKFKKLGFSAPLSWSCKQLVKISANISVSKFCNIGIGG